MTPETEQAPAGHFRRPRLSPGGTMPSGGTIPPRMPARDPRMSARDLRSLVRDTDGRVRSDNPIGSAELASEAAPARQRDAVAWPPPTRPEPTAAARARDGGSIVSVVPYLAVLIGTIAGIYVAWQQGSAGGGMGGVIGGVALLAAAVLRLVLPARLVGLLGTRKRLTDVLTLTVFGGGLLIAGLVLPH